MRWNGTHHLDPRTVAGLAAVRDRCAGRDPMLDAFLDCVLAKHDGRYWNRTYLCLPVLERLVDGPDPQAWKTLVWDQSYEWRVYDCGMVAFLCRLLLVDRENPLDVPLFLNGLPAPARHWRTFVSE